MPARTLLLLSVLPFLGTACIRAEDTAATSDSAAGVAATSTADVGAVREAIEATNARIVDAFKRGDPTAIAANFTDDAVIMHSNEPMWRGRAAFTKGIAGFLSQMSVKDFVVKVEDVMVGGDLAVETGTYEMTAQLKSGQEMKDKGKYVAAWKRQPDGSWKMVRDISNTDLPASAPPTR
jgi:uncharacterized protein (TIGR02246 family)